MTTIPDPQSTRRSEIESKPILLADGRLWGFARASTWLSPEFHTQGQRSNFRATVTAAKTRVGHSYQVEQYLTLILDEINTASSSRLWALFLTMATCLLQEAHEVDLEVCESLLRMKEEELPCLVREILGLFDRGAI